VIITTLINTGQIPHLARLGRKSFVDESDPSEVNITLNRNRATTSGPFRTGGIRTCFLRTISLRGLQIDLWNMPMTICFLPQFLTQYTEAGESDSHGLLSLFRNRSKARLINIVLCYFFVSDFLLPPSHLSCLSDDSYLERKGKDLRKERK
jgi:hypothetical protein